MASPVKTAICKWCSVPVRASGSWWKAAPQPDDEFGIHCDKNPEGRSCSAHAIHEAQPVDEWFPEEYDGYEIIDDYEDEDGDFYDMFGSEYDDEDEDTYYEDEDDLDEYDDDLDLFDLDDFEDDDEDE